jgi:hypothetical protein
VARLRTRVERAAVLHRQAAAAIAATANAVEGYSPSSAPAEQYAEQHDLAARLRSAAADLIPGWLGSGLDAVSAGTSAGGTGVPAFLRLGMAHPLDDAAFPAVAPLFGTGHLAIDADARDPRVAGLLRSVLLRLVAAAVPGALHVRVIDAAGEGDTVAAFAGLPNLPPPATDHGGMQAVLVEADQWIRSVSSAAATPPEHLTTSGPDGPSGNGAAANRTGGIASPERYFVLVIASLSELTDGNDLARIAHLARVGVAHRLHLIVAGWPPPPLTAETTQAPLPYSTQVSLRNPYVWVGDPPGATYSGSGVGPARLNAPVYLDPEPPADVIRRVCAELAAQESGSVKPPTWAPSPQRWHDYVTAAQRLDAVRRLAAKVVTDQTAAVKRVRAELATARRQIAVQQNRIGDLVRDGQPVSLRPAAADLSAADAALGRLAQAASQRAATARSAALTASTGSFPTVTGSIPTGAVINPGTGTGGFPVVTTHPGSAPQHPHPSGWAQAGQPGQQPGSQGPAAYGRNPAGTGPIQVTSPPRPGGPAQHPPVSGPGGQPPGGGPGHAPGRPPGGGSGQHPPVGPGHVPVSGPGGRPPVSGPGGRPPVSGPGGRPPVSGPGYPPVSGPGYPPVSGPAYPPVSGPGGRPPVSGMPNPVHVNTGAFPVISAPPGTGLRPPAGAPPVPAPVPAGPPSANPRLPEAAMAMIGEAHAALQRADAELSDIDARIKRSPGARNSTIYFLYAVLFALAQVPLLFMLILGDGITALAVVPCGVVLIFVSFALGWLTIGFAYREPSGQRPRRTPALGLVISLLAGTPALASTLWTVFDVFR